MIPRVSLPRPTLILGVGVSASGKSTLLNRVAKMISDAVYLDKDVINDSFLWMPKDGRRKSDKRSEISRYLPKNIVPRYYDNYRYFVDHVLFQSYHCMLMMARQNLCMGKHPILEGNYTKELGWGYIEKVLMPQLQDVDYRLKLIVAHAPPDLIRKRCIERAAERDKLVLLSDESWEQMIREQPIIPQAIEQYSHIKVDTTEPVSTAQLKEIAEFLSS